MIDCRSGNTEYLIREDQITKVKIVNSFQLIIYCGDDFYFIDAPFDFDIDREGYIKNILSKIKGNI